jgi:hypothetical protein
MRAETPEEKFNRISGIIRNLMLTSYPNPNRVGCPGPHGVENLAKFTGETEELEKRDDYQHVLHCSPCYKEYLDAREELRSMEAEEERPVPKRVQKEIARRLDGIERIMKSAERELRRG